MQSSICHANSYLHTADSLAICTVTHVKKIFRKPTNYKQITKYMKSLRETNYLNYCYKYLQNQSFFKNRKMSFHISAIISIMWQQFYILVHSRPTQTMIIRLTQCLGIDRLQMTYLSVTKTQNPSGNDFKFWLHHHHQIS